MGVEKPRQGFIQKETGITFKNVASRDEAKESHFRGWDFHNPQIYGCGFKP